MKRSSAAAPRAVGAGVAFLGCFLHQAVVGLPSAGTIAVDGRQAAQVALAGTATLFTSRFGRTLFPWPGREG
jgi:hypothetical protein